MGLSHLSLFMVMLIFGADSQNYDNFLRVPSLGRDAYVMFAWKPGSNFEDDRNQFQNLTDFYIELQRECHNCYRVQDNFPAMYYFGSLFCKDQICAESLNLTKSVNSTKDLEDLLSSVDQILNKSCLNMHKDWNNKQCHSYESKPQCTNYINFLWKSVEKFDASINESQILEKFIASNINLSYQHPETMLRQQLVVLLTNYCPADSIIALANAEKNDNIHNVKIVVVVPDESLITKGYCDKGVNWAEMNVYFVVPGGTTTFDPGVNYEPIESLQWLTLETDIEAKYPPKTMPVNIVLWMNIEYVNMTLEWIKNNIITSKLCKLEDYTKSYRFQFCIFDEDRVLNWTLPIPGPTDNISMIYFDEALKKIRDDRTTYWQNVTDGDIGQICLDANQLLQTLYDNNYDDSQKYDIKKQTERFIIIFTDQYPLPIDMDNLIAWNLNRHLEIVLLNNGSLDTSMTEIFNRSTTFLSNDSYSTTRPNHFYIVNASSEDPYKEVSTCLEEMSAAPLISIHATNQSTWKMWMTITVILGSIIFILTVGLSLRWVIKRKKPPDAVTPQSIPAEVLRNLDNGLRRTLRHSILSRHVSFVQTTEISPTMNEQRETVDQRNVGNDVVIEMETSSRSSVITMTSSIGTINIPFANNSGLTETTEIANLSAYHNELFNDPDVNKLIFSDEGLTNRFAINDFQDLGIIATALHVVKKMRHKPSKKLLAVKLVNIPYNQNGMKDEHLQHLKYLVREIKNFRELQNEPNIVKFYGFCHYETQAWLCMELMDLTLKEFSLKFFKHGENFPEELLKCVIVAVLKALAACKSKNIMHRDVKPDNILLNKDGAIKLCDFGVSRTLNNSLVSSFAGTLFYAPPERFEFQKTEFDVRSDVWSFGITLIELVSGSVPYRDANGDLQRNSIVLQKLICDLDPNRVVDENFKGYSNGIKNFVKSCLKKVEERPKFDALMATEFYKSCETIETEKLVQIWLNEYFYSIRL